MRVLIVAPNISSRMGGEAIIPYHYIRELKAQGVDITALTHARVRNEVEESAIQSCAHFHFIEDAALEKTLFRFGKMTPQAFTDTAINSAIGAVTLARLCRHARQLERETAFDVIHQPIPVSPLFPSFLNDMKAPVIIGPMNGAMSYPPAFEKDYERGSGGVVKAARAISGIANRFAPGKLKAARLLVANERTRAGLPYGVNLSKTDILVENGVDLDLWSPETRPKPETPTFVFVGRLVWWKAIDLLIEAFAKLETPARLLIIGDGPDREKLENLTKSVAVENIEFLGFRPQPEIRDLLAASTALVLPSMRECGGAVVLEAFACSTPAIATDWGGPQDYITAETGYLIKPDDRASFTENLKGAMDELAKDPQRAEIMGAAARTRIEGHFSWRAKAAEMLAIYKGAAKHGA